MCGEHQTQEGNARITHRNCSEFGTPQMSLPLESPFSLPNENESRSVSEEREGGLLVGTWNVNSVRARVSLVSTATEWLDPGSGDGGFALHAEPCTKAPF